MKVYIASSSRYMDECKDLANDLEIRYDCEITRRWWNHYVKDEHLYRDKSNAEFYQDTQVQIIREADYKAVRDADIVIIIAHYPKTLTGALLECGYAIAHHKTVIFLGEMKRSAMVSNCIFVKDKDQLFRLIHVFKGK